MMLRLAVKKEMLKFPERQSEGRLSIYVAPVVPIIYCSLKRLP